MLGCLGLQCWGLWARGRRRRCGWVLGVLGVGCWGLGVGCWADDGDARGPGLLGDAAPGGSCAACAACVFHVKHDVYRVAVDAEEWQCMLEVGRPEVDRLETRLVRNEPVINELAGVWCSRAEA